MDTSQILIQLKGTPKVFYQSSMGAATEQLACQVHKSQIASTHPSQLRRPVSHSPTNWEGSPNRMGAKAGGDNLTRMSPEMTTSLRTDSDTK